MADVDVVARGLAIGSLAVSAGSLTIAWRTFRRAGPAPRLEIETGETLEGHGQVRVAVTNGGLAPVTVEHVGLSVIELAGYLPEPQTRDRLLRGEDPERVMRFRLEGGDTRRFSWLISDIDQVAIREDSGRYFVRAEAKILGEIQRTDWVEIPARRNVRDSP